MLLFRHADNIRGYLFLIIYLYFVSEDSACFYFFCLALFELVETLFDIEK